MKSNKNKKIALNALFIAIEAVLCLISNYIIVSAAGVNINIGLIIIPLAGYILGPIGGLLVGLVNGIFTLIAPSTISFFLVNAPFWTVVVCLSKTSLAGLVSGFISKGDKKLKFLRLIFASLIVPLINTGIFALACFTCFKKIYAAEGINVTDYIVGAILSINFLIEFATTAIYSPIIYRVANVYKGED